MDDISTMTLLTELKHRMEQRIYSSSYRLDDLLLSMPKEDTMGMYFALEEYVLSYKELIEERRNEV